MKHLYDVIDEASTRIAADSEPQKYFAAAMVHCHDNGYTESLRELHESINMGVTRSCVIEGIPAWESETRIGKIIRSCYEQAKHYSSDEEAFMDFYEEATSYRPKKSR